MSPLDDVYVRETPGKAEWFAAGALCGVLVAAFFIRLGFDDPRWGTDFWQRVLVSGFGTLGSVALAVGLYYLKRRHDRNDSSDAEARERQRIEAAGLVQVVREVRDGENDHEEWITTGPLQLTRRSSQLLDYAFTLEDPQLRRFALNYSNFLEDGASVFYDVRDKLKELEEAKRKSLSRNEQAKAESVELIAQSLATARGLGKVAAYAPGILLEYVHQGGTLDSDFFQDPSFFVAKTGKPDVPEDTGLPPG